MESLLSAYSPPVFPAELFNCIIDNLGHHELGQPLDNMQLADLRACALVCKAFSNLCSSHIFSFVSINDSTNSRDNFARYIYRFIDTINYRPHLKDHVRELLVRPVDFLQVDFNNVEEVYHQLESILTTLPNVKYLAVVEPHSIFGDLSETTWKKLAPILVQTYGSHRTLRSVYLEGVDLAVDRFDCSAILLSPNIHTFELNNGMFPATQLPTSTVTNLTISISWMFPFSVLCSFPNLEKLRLMGINQITNGPHDERRLSYGLKELALALVHLPIQLILEYFHSNATFHHTLPFQRLERLELDIFYADDAPSVGALLQQTPNLRSLTLDWTNFMIHFPGQFPFEGLCLLQSCHNLSYLELRAFANDYASYTLFIDHLISLFTSVANRNQLQTLKLHVKCELGKIPLPPQAPWSQIASVLAEQTAFPYLEAVKIEITLFRSIFDLYAFYQQYGPPLSEEDAEMYMVTAMQELVCRDGVQVYLHHEENPD